MSKPTIKRKNISALCIVLFSSVAGLWSNAALGQATPHYNVLFIAVDDMNNRASVFGFPTVLTPNLQRLRKRGTVFTNAYCQFPMCNPSRTSLLSGWRPDKTGVYNNDTRPRSVMGPDVKFLPEYFKMYGYHTERVGKILHGDFENDIAWDYSDSLYIGELRYDEGSQSLTGKKDGGGSWWVTSSPDDSTANGVLVRRMLGRMRLNPPQPFFMALGLTVHNPFTPSISYWNVYGDPAAPQLLPVNRQGQKNGLSGNGSSNIVLPATPAGDRSDVPPVAFPSQVLKSTTEWQNTVHAYYAEVTGMDKQLGLIFDELERKGLWDSTVIVFWSDHGQHLGEHEGTWLKNTLFEESVKAPLIVCVPGKRPAVSKALVEMVDIYPSMAAICGLPAPAGMEGTSFLPLLDNPARPWKRAAFTQVQRYNNPPVNEYGLVTSQYRYNSWGKDGEELYDHKTDPFEYVNQVLNPSYATILSNMRKLMAGGWTRVLPPADPVAINAVTTTNDALQKTGELKVYPNPSKGEKIFVELQSEYNESVHIVVHNSAGKIVQQMTNFLHTGNNILSFSAAERAAGVYTIAIKGKQLSATSLFVLQ